MKNYFLYFTASKDIHAENISINIENKFNEEQINKKGLFGIKVMNENMIDEEMNKYFTESYKTLYMSVHNYAVYDYDNFEGISKEGFLMLAQKIKNSIVEGIDKEEVNIGDNIIIKISVH